MLLQIIRKILYSTVLLYFIKNGRLLILRKVLPVAGEPQVGGHGQALVHLPCVAAPRPADPAEHGEP